jgi:hypothetical protein
MRKRKKRREWREGREDLLDGLSVDHRDGDKGGEDSELHGERGTGVIMGSE